MCKFMVQLTKYLVSGLVCIVVHKMWFVMSKVDHLPLIMGGVTWFIYGTYASLFYLYKYISTLCLTLQDLCEFNMYFAYRKSVRNCMDQ